jgi:hypothetical protein
MRVGDLVKWRRDQFRKSAPVGVVVKNAESHQWSTVWWMILWSNSKTEVISERNLMVIS